MYPNEEEAAIYAYDDYIRKIPKTRPVWQPRGIAQLSGMYPSLPPRRNMGFSIFAPVRPGLPNPLHRRKKGKPFRRKLTINKGKPVIALKAKPPGKTKLKPKPKSKKEKGKGKPKKRKNQMPPVAPPKEGKNNMIFWGIGIALLLTGALLVKTIRDNKK